MLATSARSLLLLWPGMRAVLREFFSEGDIRHLLAAATVPSSVGLSASYKSELLEACDLYFTVKANRAEPNEALRTKEVQLAHLAQEVIDQLGRLSDPQARQRLEELFARNHFAIVGNRVVPIELQVPQELTDLSDRPLAAMKKAIVRYMLGDRDGALTAICAAVDGACEELAAGTVDRWTELDFVQKVSHAHGPCMARLQAAGGFSAEEMKAVSNNNRRSVLAAAEVLARFRREYSDAHGVKATAAPAVLVQIAFDSAVYLLRVLATRQG